MRFFPRAMAALKCILLMAACVLIALTSALASAYNGHPKLVVVIVIDQFRGDYLERYRDQFGEGGFKLFLDHGANFTDCNYDYANTRTAPGHATLFTGAYSNSHGIVANEWWDPKKKRVVTSRRRRRQIRSIASQPSRRHTRGRTQISDPRAR
jgi:predicted AlkP superfamily pyrophosphatase or phosphodiesterase